MDPELRQVLDDMEKRLTERIERIETKLFDAAYGLAGTYEMRSRGQSKAIAILDERLGLR